MGRKASLRAQDVVEYALLVPIMMLALVVLFDLGRWVYTYTVLANAAREGARYASVRDNTMSIQIETYIDQRLPGLDPSLLTVNFDWSKYQCSDTFLSDGSKIRVAGQVGITLDYTIDSILLGNLVASAGSTMKMERCLP